MSVFEIVPAGFFTLARPEAPRGELFMVDCPVTGDAELVLFTDRGLAEEFLAAWPLADHGEAVRELTLGEAVRAAEALLHRGARGLWINPVVASSDPGAPGLDGPFVGADEADVVFRHWGEVARRPAARN
jgi:hypothetical protein